MLKYARLSLLLILSGGAAPAFSLPTPMTSRNAVASILARNGVCIDTSPSRVCTPPPEQHTTVVWQSSGLGAAEVADSDVGPIYPVAWAVASLTASAWFVLAYVASGWFAPFSRRLREQRRSWISLAVVCSQQAFTGGPSATVLWRDSDTCALLRIR